MEANLPARALAERRRDVGRDDDGRRRFGREGARQRRSARLGEGRADGPGASQLRRVGGSVDLDDGVEGRFDSDLLDDLFPPLPLLPLRDKDLLLALLPGGLVASDLGAGFVGEEGESVALLDRELGPRFRVEDAEDAARVRGSREISEGGRRLNRDGGVEAAAPLAKIVLLEPRRARRVRFVPRVAQD